MPKNIVFIDSRVPDYQTITAGLGSDTRWYLLNKDEHGVEQMAHILSEHRDLDSTQIFSHGSEGRLHLGSGVLDAGNLDDHAPALRTIGASLTDTGDILLYGCDVASGETGMAFLQALSERTGADISASADITGKGGDWDLEAATGTIEASVLSIPDYAHTLAADTTAPELTSLVIPDTVDLSQGDASFTISAGATDDLSGVDRVVVWFGDEIATDIGSYRLVIISDSYNDSWAGGASSVTRTVLDTNQSGTYQVTKVDIQDHQGNSRSYSTSELEALGFNTSLTLTGSTADTTAPELTSLVIPDTVDLSQGNASFTISASAMDDLSGVNKVVVWFDQTLATNIGSHSLVSLSGYSDSWADGASSETRTVLDTNQPGTYQVTSVDIEDNQGNSRSYLTAELEALGVNTSLTLIGSTADTTAPELTSLVIPDTVDLSQGNASFTISASAMDDLSGVNKVVVWFDQTLATNIGSHSLVSLSGYSDSWADGASSETRTVLDTNQPGTYQVTSVDIEDNQGNSRSYLTAELEALGVHTSITLTHGAVDNIPLANVTTEFIDGMVEVIITPSEWQTSSNEVSLQISYDANKFSFESASLMGSGSSNTSSLISEVGGTGSASLSLSLNNGQHTGAFKLTFIPEISTASTFGATIDSISINGISGALTVPDVAVVPINHSPIGEVIISGTLMEGETLSVSHNLADEDGLGTLSYQWLADSVEITGATGTSYTLTAADVGKHLSVQVSYTDGRGNFETQLSSNTPVVDALPEDPVSIPVTGQVYHWKNHALLTDVELKLTATGSGTSTAAELYELRNIEMGTDGRVTFELWTNLSSPVGNLDVRLTLDSDAAVVFTADSDSLPAGWQLLEGSDSQSTLNLSGIGLTEISGAVQLGQLSLTLPDGMTQTRIDVSGTAGDGVSLQTQSAYSVTAGHQQATTDADGGFGFELLEDSAYSLDISKALTEGETGRAINSADALAALKIAVGLNPNTDPDGSGPLDALEISPYQLIAADVNQDGRVNSADALAILKMAVQRSDAPEREWLFVSESENFWDETANHGAGGYTSTRSHVDWNREQVIDGSSSNLNQVAVLKGDVNGSWSALADSQYVPDAYFSQLELAGAGPASQWAVLPV